MVPDICERGLAGADGGSRLAARVTFAWWSNNKPPVLDHTVSVAGQQMVSPNVLCPAAVRLVRLVRRKDGLPNDRERAARRASVGCQLLCPCDVVGVLSRKRICGNTVHVVVLMPTTDS